MVGVFTNVLAAALLGEEVCSCFSTRSFVSGDSSDSTLSWFWSRVILSLTALHLVSIPSSAITYPPTTVTIAFQSLGQRAEAEIEAMEVRGHEVVILSTILYIFVFALQCLVILARLRTKFFLRMEGVLILLAMIPATFYFVVTLVANDDFQRKRHLVSSARREYSPRF